MILLFTLMGCILRHAHFRHISQRSPQRAASYFAAETCAPVIFFDAFGLPADAAPPLADS